MTLKEAGKGDTNSHEEIPIESLDEIFKLTSTLQAIMRIKDKTLPKYQELFSMLPENFQDSYHVLINFCKMFIVAFQFAMRGVEGIAYLKKCHFEEDFDKENNYRYLKKNFRGLIKNQR